MKKSEWVWMPHAGHFICGNKCEFHLFTYVGKYVVSTVGELWFERGVREIHAQIYDPIWFSKNKSLQGDVFDVAYFKRFGYEKIGADRLYETMVFEAKKSDRRCCPYKVAKFIELDAAGYNDPGAAYEGHLKMCEKWTQKS